MGALLLDWEVSGLLLYLDGWFGRRAFCCSLLLLRGLCPLGNGPFEY